jgi:hypothetical protein
MPSFSLLENFGANTTPAINPFLNIFDYATEPAGSTRAGIVTNTYNSTGVKGIVFTITSYATIPVAGTLRVSLLGRIHNGATTLTPQYTERWQVVSSISLAVPGTGTSQNYSFIFLSPEMVLPANQVLTPIFSQNTLLNLSTAAQIPVSNYQSMTQTYGHSNIPANFSVAFQNTLGAANYSWSAYSLGVIR